MYDDPVALAEGELLVRVVAEIRKFKHDSGLALNAPLGKVTIYSAHTQGDEGDAGRAMNADIHWRKDTAKLVRDITDIRFDKSIIGKTFRKQAQAFMDAVKKLPPEQMENPPKTISVEGSVVDIPAGAFSPVFSYMEEGEKVDVLTVGDVIVTISKH